MEHGSKAGDLPDDAHVVRYVKPRKLLGDGSVDGSEFRLRPDDNFVCGLTITACPSTGSSVFPTVRKRSNSLK